MAKASKGKRKKGTKKIRVAFRRNRSKPARTTDWTRRAADAVDHEIDADRDERVAAKGDVSRRRTIVVHDDTSIDTFSRGTIIAMRGLYAEVDDGSRVLPCTVRRILRTRLTKERSPVTVGDRVRFRLQPACEGVVQEGVIEHVDPRCGLLRRKVGRRIHTIVANVDQAVIVSSADQPTPKPRLIDRYIVAAHVGDIVPILCFNKIDLPTECDVAELVERYAGLGYTTLTTSAITGEGIEALRGLLQGKASVVAGQSGVGKSSLLNAIQPGLQLATAQVIEALGKGRHTTTTARLLRLDGGGYVVDTPGVRSFDLSTVGRYEFEEFFVEFVSHLADCKFPDCTHTHEHNCAVKRAVETGEIHPQRYESYCRLFEEPTAPDWETRTET